MAAQSSEPAAASGPLSIDSATDALLALSAKPPGDEEKPGDASADEAEPEAEAVEETKPDDAADSDELDEEGESLDAQTVDLDGKPVTVAELKAGYLRQSDYTRKTQELADGRRLVEQKVNEFVSQRSAQLSRLNDLVAAFESRIPSQQSEIAELSELRKTDPGEYSARVTEIEQRQRMISAARAQQSAIADAQRAEDINRERAALLEAMPEWKDHSAFEQHYGALGKYVLSQGYSADEWDNTTSHRDVLMAWKAMQYDESTRKSEVLKKKVVALPRVQRPGVSQDAGDSRSRSYTQALDRLRKGGGGIEDAASAFMARDAQRR